MLQDQKFLSKHLIVLGSDFFCDAAGELDYTFVVYFRTMTDLVTEQFDFHFWELDTPEAVQRIEILDAWGVPVVFGCRFDVVPTKELKRRCDTMLLGVQYVWAKEFSRAYRIDGKKDLSLLPPELFLSALVTASNSPDPDALRNAVLGVQLQGQGI